MGYKTPVEIELTMKMYWNMALTTVNIAKITHWMASKKQNTNQEKYFSMADIKTHYNK